MSFKQVFYQIKLYFSEITVFSIKFPAKEFLKLDKYIG